MTQFQKKNNFNPTPPPVPWSNFCFFISWKLYVYITVAFVSSVVIGIIFPRPSGVLLVQYWETRNNIDCFAKQLNAVWSTIRADDSSFIYTGSDLTVCEIIVAGWSILLLEARRHWPQVVPDSKVTVSCTMYIRFRKYTQFSRCFANLWKC